MVCASLILTLEFNCFYFIITCLHLHVVHMCRCTCDGMYIGSREQLVCGSLLPPLLICRDWIHITWLVQQGHLHDTLPQWPEMFRYAKSPQWPQMLGETLNVLTLQLVWMQSCGCAKALYKFCLTFDVSRSYGSPQVILRHKASLRCIP